jgi:hypothetical protein
LALLALTYAVERVNKNEQSHVEEIESTQSLDTDIQRHNSIR